jgi:Flp pilus assembly protein TadD
MRRFHALPPLRRGPVACALALALAGCALPMPDKAPDDAQVNKPTPSLDNAATHAALVRQMQEKGMWYASLAHIDALEQRWGASDESRLLRAEALRHTEQFDAAARLYEQLTRTPLRAAAWRGLGLVAGTQGRYAEAVAHFERARQVNPTDGLLLSDLGFALIMDRRYDEARLPIMQAAQLLPTHPKVRSNMALYLLVQNRPEEAARFMNEAGLSPATREAIERLARGLGHGTAVPAATAARRHTDAARPAGQGPAGAAGNTTVARGSAGADDTLRLRSSLHLELSRALAREPGSGEPSLPSPTSRRADQP